MSLWIDTDGSGGWRQPSGNGQCLINCHAGSTDSWTPSAYLVFWSKTKSDDYHNEMYSLHFLKCFEKALIPKLPPNSLIILDNAKDHNMVVEKILTRSSTKN